MPGAALGITVIQALAGNGLKDVCPNHYAVTLGINEQ